MEIKLFAIAVLMVSLGLSASAQAGTYTGSTTVGAGILKVDGPVTNAIAGQELWTTDFEAAKAQAAKENKDILVFFTGSDWCGWCKILKKEVLDTPAFQAAAPKQFVLEEADFPQKTKLPPALEAQNKKLHEQFGVQGKPAVVMLDAQGRPYAQIGYRPGGPEQYLAMLSEFQACRAARDAAWKQAEAAQGVERAKWLAVGLDAMDEEIAIRSYGSVLEEIKKLDPQDTLGLAKKMEYKARLEVLKAAVSKARGKDNNRAAALKAIDDFIAVNKPEAEALQKARCARIGLYSTKSLADMEELVRQADEIIAIAPGTWTSIWLADVKRQGLYFQARLNKTAPATP